MISPFHKSIFLQFQNSLKLLLQNVHLIFFFFPTLKMTYRRFINSSFCSFETAENYLYKTSYSLPSCLKSTVSKSSFSKVLKQLKTSFLKQRKIILVVLKKPFSCSSDTPKKSGIETASMPAF